MPTKAKYRPNANTFVGYPVVDDARLVKLVLTLPLGETLRREILAIQPALEPGKFGQLTKRDRDTWMRLVIDAGLLKSVSPQASKGIHISINPGTYEERRIKNTDLVEAVVAWQVPSLGGVMPLPPHRLAAELKAKAKRQGRAHV